MEILPIHIICGYPLDKAALHFRDRPSNILARGPIFGPFEDEIRQFFVPACNSKVEIQKLFDR